jgi:hypothetical protein
MTLKLLFTQNLRLLLRRLLLLLLLLWYLQVLPRRHLELRQVQRPPVDPLQKCQWEINPMRRMPQTRK